MPKLANRRHEIFAVELAAGTPLLTSYLRAGYKDTYSARYNASRLKNSIKVHERVAELLDDFRDRAFVGIQYVQAELVKIIENRAYSAERFEDGKEVKQRDRLAALAQLARTLLGTKVEVTHDLADGVTAGFAKLLSPEDQRTLADLLEALAKQEVGESDASPTGEAAPAQAGPGCREPQLVIEPAKSSRPPRGSESEQPEKLKTSVAPPPAAQPSKSGRRRFLQLARMRTGGVRPLDPEFSRLRADVQRTLARFCSPSLRDEKDCKTWPASPLEIREALERLAPAELDELLNLMAANSDALMGCEPGP